MNDIVRIMKAADFAARKHTDQRRKGDASEPYVNHLIEVADLVAESTEGKPDAVVAALLHGVVEDQGVTIAEIARLFGNSVASLVAEVTDEKSLPKQERKDKQIETASHGDQACGQDEQLARIGEKPAVVADRAEARVRPMGEGGRGWPALQAVGAAGAIRRGG